MSVVNNNLLLTADAGVSQYQVSRSLRFNSADSAYLNRTPTVAGNRTTWTWSGWVKRSALDTNQILFQGFVSGSAEDGLLLTTSNTLRAYTFVAPSSFTSDITTTQVFRDCSAWYHILWAWDTNNATAAQRSRLYVNGVQIITFSTASYPSSGQVSAINSNVGHQIGRNYQAVNYLSAYLADVHFIDGQALTPSSFTETNATTGQLVPKAYTGTYGTNGFRLNFSDNSAATAATLGADSGGGISSATGALPIYNTTDNYGIIKGTGTRTDANASSLVLAIPMDGANNGTTFTDESANIKGSGTAKAITRNGDTKTLTAQSKFYGSSGFFDGTGDYLSTTVPGGLGSGSFTVEFWYYKTANSGMLFNSRTSGTGSDGIDIFHDLVVTTAFFGLFPSGVTIPINTWTHVAIVRNGTTYTRYIDGVANGTVTNSNNLSGTSFLIGGSNVGNTGYLNGYMQDIRVYSGLAKYTSNFTPTFGPNNWTPNNLSVLTGGPYPISTSTGGLPIYNTTDTYGAVKGTGTRTDSNASSLVLAIPMDGANNGTTFTDESATIKGSGTAKAITKFGDTKTLTAQSKFYGSSGFFDGNGDYLTIPANADFAFGTGDFTIEFWMKRVDTGNNVGLFDTRTNNADGGGCFIRFTSSTSIQFLNGAQTFSSTLTHNAEWNHIAFVRNAGVLTGYANGTANTSVSGATSNFTSTLFLLGGFVDAKASPNAYGGYLQDLRIYKGVAKYTSNFTPPTATQNTTVAAGNDSLTDTPTSYGTDTGAGGEVRGNYATLNPLDNGGLTLANGNLQFNTSINSWLSTRATVGMSNGSWYWEVIFTSGTDIMIGISKNDAAQNSYVGAVATGWGYNANGGAKYNNGIGVAYGAGFSVGDIIGVAFNATTGVLTFYKNGISQGVAYSGLTSGPYFPAVSAAVSGSGAYCNFGQRPFAYAAPSGFKALCDANLPAPTIAKGSSVFDTVLYTGTGAALTPTSSLAFSPDLVWIKGRSGATNHALYDTVRGATFDLVSNSTAAETTQTQGLTAFNSNGFTVGTLAKLNTSAATYAGWCWDAGSSTVTNTAGTITSQVRANPSAGFSVVTFTCPASGAYSFGHGLGVSPAMVILKDKGDGRGLWCVYHSSATSISQYLTLNTTNAIATLSGIWGSAITSTVVGSTANIGIFLNSTAVAYCFAPVTGYSAFGSYTGNGSADGPFVYLGFRPAFLMMKRTDTTGNWTILDNKRLGYNADNDAQYPNLAAVDGTGDLLDITSNGFKLRSTNADVNANAGTYIYAAFAENPFQYARAR